MEHIRRYHLDLYPMACIRQAILDYSEIAYITLEESGPSRICVIFPCIPNTSIIIDEFGNYLLQLIASRDGLEA